MSFDLGDYKPVAERLVEFFAKHPEGSLRPLDEAQPFEVRELDGRLFIVYVCAAYRSPDDPRPGIGMAWEPYPGKSNYTRESELMNAETSAWGRAILAVGASDTKGGVASQEEVRNRRESGPQTITKKAQRAIRLSCEARGIGVEALEVLVRKVMDGETDDLEAVTPGDRFEELKSEIKAWRNDASGAASPNEATAGAVPAAQDEAPMGGVEAEPPGELLGLPFDDGDAA